MSEKLSRPLSSTAPAAPDAGRQRGHTRVVRVGAYSVATVLAVLMTSATLPPLLADQSDRAVINAPITLLTAPISGEVPQVLGRVGQRLEPGEAVANIHNGRVDKTTLIQLDGKVEELQGSLLATRQKKDADNKYVAALDAEIRRQADQTVGRLESEVAEARARVSSADAEGLARKAVVDRQQSLINRDVVSATIVRPAEQHYAAARFDKDAEVARLNQRIAQLDGLKKGIFVGNELNSLAVLAQKRRDLAFDAQRMAIEESQLAVTLKGQQALLDAERKRHASLSDATLRATNGGVILNLGVAPGRHVSPGDLVATLVDCEQAFVVGIFSYRQAQELAVGTPVRVSASGEQAPRRGTVSEILPKTNDKTDEQYAVPFPPTERREMYVLVGLDKDSAPAGATVPATARTSPCQVGQWVTVTRENGWIPSASVTWTSVSNGVDRVVAGIGTLVSSVFRPEPASARDRARD